MSPCPLAVGFLAHAQWAADVQMATDGPESLPQLLSGYGRRFFDRLDLEAREAVLDAFQPRLHLASFYSGWDAYAHGASEVAGGAGLDCASSIDFFHASEVVPERQQFLLCHPVATRPRHVFGDVCSRLDEHERRGAADILLAHQHEALEKIVAGWCPVLVKQQVQDDLYECLRQHVQGEPLLTEQDCAVCRSTCSVWDVADDGGD